MKKIGILTYHRSINYGAFIQSYSLSKKIYELTGIKAEVIDYEPATKHNSYLKGIVVSTDLSLLGPFRNYKRYKAFQDSIKKLPLSPETIITNDANLLTNSINGKYDILITGSDAVFNYNGIGLPNPYWLHGFNDVVKMSYAASAHGMDFDKISSTDYITINNLLKDFSYIGVRDEETMKLVKKANKELPCYRNCDPTVFLDINGYTTNLENKLNKYNIPTGKKLLGVMVYDRELGKKIKEKYGDEYILVSLYRNNPYTDIYLYDLNPFEWSQVFSRFELLITKYFHGTLLSLNNTTPVISIDYSKNVEKYQTKLKDLLYRLGLKECYFTRSQLETENGYEELFNTIDKVLKNSSDFKHKIINGFVEEIKYSESFFSNLEKILNK